jgi:hypothetical protein
VSIARFIKLRVFRSSVQKAIPYALEQGNYFDLSGVAIFSCGGGRDEASEQAVAAAFYKGGAERATRLYRRDNVPEDQCWLRAPGWCLACG